MPPPVMAGILVGEASVMRVQEIVAMLYGHIFLVYLRMRIGVCSPMVNV